MSDSTELFWRMVWEQNVSVIVMITHLYEGGKVRTMGPPTGEIFDCVRHPSCAHAVLTLARSRRDFPARFQQMMTKRRIV
jgi:hypothetical protein